MGIYNVYIKMGRLDLCLKIRNMLTFLQKKLSTNINVKYSGNDGEIITCNV